MENKDYQVAKITDSCKSTLDKMEKEMCKESNKDIILVAYQSKTAGE